MAKYKLMPNGVKDTETGALIPADLSNRHWLEYLEWTLDSENVPDPEETPEEVQDRIQAALTRLYMAKIRRRMMIIAYNQCKTLGEIPAEWELPQEVG